MTDRDYLDPIDDGLVIRSFGSWTAEKLDYLRRYIDIFETSMRLKWPERNYIDLFSGPGKIKIKTTGQILLGSPLLALTTQYPFFQYYFSDNNPQNTKALELRCSASLHSDLVKIYLENANLIIKTIVANIRQYSPRSLNLAFLDPDGLELEWSTLAHLGTLRCDLIIHYSQQGITRYIARAYETNAETIIDKFFGTDEWRQIYAPWHTKPRISGMHRELIDFYKDRLRSLGYQEVRQSDEILSAPLIRNRKRNAPLYRLLFASKSTLGDEFWQKVTQRDLYGQKQMF